MSTKEKLFKLGCCFVFVWTIGEVFNDPHRQNLINTLSFTACFAIFLGLHSDIVNIVSRITGVRKDAAKL